MTSLLPLIEMYPFSLEAGVGIYTHRNAVLRISTPTVKIIHAPENKTTMVSPCHEPDVKQGALLT